MAEIWQLYSNWGEPIEGKGVDADDITRYALLHGAAHIWIWKRSVKGKEILLQKRASNKLTWPSYYDASAAGHIDLNESPVEAALRETKEEINLNIKAEELTLINVHRRQLPVPNTDLVENEFCWIFVCEIKNDTELIASESEVESLDWVNLDEFKKLTKQVDSSKFVPHGDEYFQVLINSLEEF